MSTATRLRKESEGRMNARPPSGTSSLVLAGSSVRSKKRLPRWRTCPLRRRRPSPSEMSFKAKVAVLSSLVRPQLPQRKFNTGFEKPTEVWNDIVRMLFTAEELRNKFYIPIGARKATKECEFGGLRSQRKRSAEFESCQRSIRPIICWTCMTIS